MTGYDFRALQDRWLPVWESLGLFSPSSVDRYIVSMFAYPSGDLHMGHAEVYAIGDVIARYWRLRGFGVLHPVGWDSFGLPAENAARRRGLDPAEWTYANIATQAESFRRYAVSFDWSTRLHTSDPSYYKWTQWLFLRFFSRGLAYRASAAVNWCPVDETVLANEQVIGGRCERCGTLVVSRELNQWFFRITAYADRLLDDLDRLEGHWPAHVLTMQRNWIGRSAPGSYHLHDWLISRQRSWGCPIPIVHCPSCGVVPVPDDQLPVVVDGSPVFCPKCAEPAQRETDTMDTFVDSSWYFLRYPNVSYADGPFDPARVRPVDHYIGGSEHAVSHLLYARFFTKVLHDLGMIDFDEPFRRLTTQGQVILNGAAMSKSKGNMVELADQLDRYGVDAVRVSLLFAGPPEDDVDWADVSPGGSARFLSRALRLASVNSVASTGDSPLRRTTHRLLREITDLLEATRLNVALARTMELVNAVRAAPPDDPARLSATEAVAVVLSLFAPYTAEEMWHRLGHPPGVAVAGWPAIDPDLAAAETVVCVVQVNGKVRDRLSVPPDITSAALRTLALASPTAAGLRVTRAIVRPPKLVNLISSEVPSR
ncbi:leucine--tRNA ligase [Paractinoplanes globisporus]|uniref:leucine--tRNA ligase n=1 Tax=Paractinoplanes globisporus TaxID=113565 RepID=A0ABW6WD53_9ACTN|nr:leucine--tRNA ligase [Actinoplanes globisporus]